MKKLGEKAFPSSSFILRTATISFKNATKLDESDYSDFLKFLDFPWQRSNSLAPRIASFAFHGCLKVVQIFHPKQPVENIYIHFFY